MRAWVALWPHNAARHFGVAVTCCGLSRASGIPEDDVNHNHRCRKTFVKVLKASACTKARSICRAEKLVYICFSKSYGCDYPSSARRSVSLPKYPHSKLSTPAIRHPAHHSISRARRLLRKVSLSCYRQRERRSSPSGKFRRWALDQSFH